MVKKTKILTIEDILKKKNLIEVENKNYYCEYYDAEIEVVDADPNAIIEILSSDEDQYRQYLELIYISCPMFKSKELRESVEVKEPYEAIEKIFNNRIADIMKLGNFILRKYGYLDNDVVEKVKK